MDQLKYLEIEEFIIKKIKNEEYIADEKIPSELDFAKMFDVSRMTARKALENLVSKNYLYKIERKGTYVKDNDEKSEINLDEIVSFEKRVKKEGKLAETQVLKFELKKPNKLIVKKMNLEEDEKVYYYERVRLIDKEPFALEIGYIPERFAKMKQEDVRGSIYEFMGQNNLKIKSLKKEYIAIVPDSKIKEILNIRNNIAVFKIEYANIIQGDEMFQYTKVYYNQNRYKFIQIVNA